MRLRELTLLSTCVATKRYLALRPLLIVTVVCYLFLLLYSFSLVLLVLTPSFSSPNSLHVGFQFGSFAGQLGDGRALYLGEVTSLSPSPTFPFPTFSFPTFPSPMFPSKLSHRSSTTLENAGSCSSRVLVLLLILGKET